MTSSVLPSPLKYISFKFTRRFAIARHRSQPLVCGLASALCNSKSTCNYLLLVPVPPPKNAFGSAGIKLLVVLVNNVLGSGRTFNIYTLGTSTTTELCFW